MFLFFLTMIGMADTPMPKADEEITVVETRYEEIYVEDPRVISNDVSNYEYDVTVIFT